MRELGPCLLRSAAKPDQSVIISRLNEAKPEMQQRAKELEQQQKAAKAGKGFW